MTAAICSVLAVAFQIGLILLQQWATRVNAANAAKAALSKGISDATSSGDVSRINSVIQQLRR